MNDQRRNTLIAILALVMISVHLLLRFYGPAISLGNIQIKDLPLLLTIFLGGLPMIWDLLVKVRHGEFGADLLAGISIVTSVLLNEYLAGSIVVLMLSGGAALEAFAVRRASSALSALSKRMPSVTHRRGEAGVVDIALQDVVIGDVLVIFPHEICPVDGTVVEGRGVMDESYLTGEPYMMSKVPGATVLSGAVNGESALTIRADKVAADSRYAKIMQVMRESEQHRPHMRRLADQLGAWYTPLAVGIALAAWAVSGEAIRFLAVLVVATPCPLLIAIPVALIGAISLAARRGIIIKDPTVLETIDTCTIAVFDKTGTLTIGQPRLNEILTQPGFDTDETLRLVASLEQYSKHPLAEAVRHEARKRRLDLEPAGEVREPPGEGMTGTVSGRRIRVTNRKKLLARDPSLEGRMPPTVGGLECVIVVDDQYAATFRFRDQPRREGKPFISHLGKKHRFQRVILTSGDRDSEVRHLANQVGITEVHSSQSPEQKVELIRELTKSHRTLFVGDGINDAPALTAATVGLAFGAASDITGQAAGAVILECSLTKVDEFLHISQRLRRIALQSAVGGMALSLLGMAVAALGFLPPVGGALTQEVIDVFAIANALRVAVAPAALSDNLEPTT